MVQGEIDLQLERAIVILTALSRMIERLRRVADLLRAGRRDRAGVELRLLLAQLEGLIAMLAEEPLPARDGKKLLHELHLVREDIAPVGLFPHT